jgi:uncharacterized protein (TIGR02757 family)
LSFPACAANLIKVIRVAHLDIAYGRYMNKAPDLYQDPVSLVHRFSSIGDREIAGFIAAQFAYGKIELFMSFLEKLFAVMGNGPVNFIRDGRFEALSGMYYRFHRADDLVMLFDVLKRILDEHGTFGAMFRTLYDGNTQKTIWRIRERYVPDGKRLLFFFPRARSAGAQKRWNMFLRWMVRKDDMDLGIWDFIDPADLIVPLDTHIYKIGKCLGWITGNTPSFRAAREVTEALKKFSPTDPLKYDFFLCHGVGISAGCTGRRTKKCKEKCAVYDIQND